MNAFSPIATDRPDLSPLALAERLATALRHAPKQPLPAQIAALEYRSPWHVAYYRLVDGEVRVVREGGYTIAHSLTYHNENASYAGATHFAAWEPTGELRYNGPVLNALGRPTPTKEPTDA